MHRRTPTPHALNQSGIYASLEELIALKQQKIPKQLRRTRHQAQTGIHRSTIHHRGIDLSEVRHYQSGDELRHMQWRITAKTGKPHVKLYEESRDHPIMLVVDFNTSMYFGTRIRFKSVQAAYLAAMITWSAYQAHESIGGILYSPDKQRAFSPKKHHGHAYTLLQCLSTYTQTRPQSPYNAEALMQALSSLRQILKPQSLVIIISDFYTLTPKTIQHIQYLKHHHDVIAYHIVDPLEQKGPKFGTYAFTNLTETVLLDLQDHVSQQAYEAICQERIHTVETLFRSHHLPYFLVEPSTDLPMLLAQSLLRRSHG